MATARSDACCGVILVRGVKEKMQISFVPTVMPAVKVVIWPLKRWMAQFKFALFKKKRAKKGLRQKLF